MTTWASGSRRSPWRPGYRDCPVRSLYSSALILLPFFTSGLALAQSGGFRRLGIEENTRSSPRAEPAPGQKRSTRSPSGALSRIAQGRRSRGKPGFDTPEIGVNRSLLHDGRNSVLLKRVPQSPGELLISLRSLFGGPNSLFSRVNSLFAPKNSLFLCAGNFRVSYRKYVVNSA